MTFRYEVRVAWWQRPIVAFKQWRWKRRLGLKTIDEHLDAQLRERGLATSTDALSLAQYLVDRFRRPRR